MPVTKTAKRALRGSRRKAAKNSTIKKSLEIALRLARRTKKETDVKKAVSLADMASKKDVIHKNRASRIKSSLSKI